MSKRLIIILALAFVVGIAFTAYAEVQNVKVSGDLAFFGIARNQFALKKAAGLKNEATAASIARIRVDADLTDNVIATVRLLNERYWGDEYKTTYINGNDANSASGSDNTNIALDLAYVTLKEFLYSPLTITVGRQELHFGNEMIIGDVDTNRQVTAASPFSNVDEDLSARKAFDAVRATLDYNPLVIDLIAAKIEEKHPNNNDDQDLWGINAKYDLGRKNTTVEGYLFTKNTSRKSSQANTSYTNAKAKTDRVNTVGVLVKSQPIENLATSLELAYQFGKFFDNTNITTTYPSAYNNVADRQAWAIEAGANYTFAKVKYTPSVTVLGAWFSGAKNPSILGNENRKTYTGWDPMFENQKYGDIANAQFAQSNARLVGGIASIKPMSDVTLQGEYYAYWWDRKFPDGSTTSSQTNVRGYTFVMRNKRFAGQEIDLKATYDYTEDVQLALMGGWFLPGSSFNDDESVSSTKNHNIASEVIGSMKVTF